MKKVFLLFSLLLMLSCSNSDNNTNSSNSDFHPPVWIQGRWLQQGSIGSNGVLFNFSEKDFCFTNIGIANQCQQEFVNQLRLSSNSNVVVTEIITAAKYTAEIKYQAGQSFIYSFRKLSNNSIEWTAVPGSVLIKQ